jgi:biofilm PGA synthesis lipoprotein PgaB
LIRPPAAETQAQFEARMRADVVAISTRSAPSPARHRGCGSGLRRGQGTSLAIVGEQGYEMALTLDDGLDSSTT